MDLWEASGGNCKLRLAGGDSLAVRAEATEDGVRLREVKDDNSANNAALVGDAGPRILCCGRRARSQGLPRLLRYADLLSATMCSEASECDATLRLVHCPKPAGNPDAGRLRKDIELEIAFDAQDIEGQWSLRLNVQAWATEVTRRCLPKCHPSRRARAFLVFINPHSGKGQALQIWATARDLWDAMGPELVTWKEVVTTHQGHAHTYVKDSPDILDYDGIIIVSGDGLVHEVFNGLSLRSDAQSVLESLPVGHIPGGSGNGLATSILKSAGESYGVLDSAFIIVKGGVQTINLMETQMSGRPPCVTFLTLSGAIISDIDIESEKLRCMGGARFTAWALYRVMRLRPLRAKLTYWPAEEADTPPIPAPSLEDPLEGAPWKIIEDDFSVFWGSNVAWGSYDTCPAPAAQLHDGLWYLVIVRASAPRTALIRFLLGLETGAHADHTHVEIIPCRAFRLVPQLDIGFLSLDGEQVQFGPTQVWPTVLQGRVLGAPFETCAIEPNTV